MLTMLHGCSDEAQFVNLQHKHNFSMAHFGMMLGMMTRTLEGKREPYCIPHHTELHWALHMLHDGTGLTRVVSCCVCAVDMLGTTPQQSTQAWQSDCTCEYNVLCSGVSSVTATSCVTALCWRSEAACSAVSLFNAYAAVESADNLQYTACEALPPVCVTLIIMTAHAAIFVHVWHATRSSVDLL